MPSSSGAEWAVACPVCPLQTPYFDTESEAIAAWNTRLTAQSGEGRSGAGEDAEQIADRIAARQSGEGEREADFRGRAISEAIELIDELNERATSRKFWGISQTMHSKLCTIRATLLRAALRATDDAGGA